MKKILVAVVVVALAVAAFAWLRATRPQPVAAKPEERVWRVEMTEVSPRSARAVLTLYGRVEAPDRLRVAAPVAGRLAEVAVRDGDRVEAGTLLARLAVADLAPRRETAAAELARERLRQQSDRAALAHERELVAVASAQVARLSRLAKAQLSAASALEQAQADLARAELALTQREAAIREAPEREAAARARLAEAERDLERSRMQAPFAGRVGRVEMAAGDQVSPGQVVLTLLPESARFLRALVPAADALPLRRALDAGATLQAEAWLGGERLDLTLERMAGEADARGVDVLLRLPDGADVPVGTFLNAALVLPPVADVLVLPASALHQGDRIYLVKEGRLVSRTVRRLGETRDAGQVRLLLDAPSVAAASTVMLTHLPNAIDGLAVAPVVDDAPGAQPAAVAAPPSADASAQGR